MNHSSSSSSPYFSNPVYEEYTVQLDHNDTTNQGGVGNHDNDDHSFHGVDDIHTNKEQYPKHESKATTNDDVDNHLARTIMDNKLMGSSNRSIDNIEEVDEEEEDNEDDGDGHHSNNKIDKDEERPDDLMGDRSHADQFRQQRTNLRRLDSRSTDDDCLVSQSNDEFSDDDCQGSSWLGFRRRNTRGNNNSTGGRHRQRSIISTIKKNNPLAIGDKETKDVFILRMIVFAVLVCSAILVGVLVYMYSHTNEVSRFNDHYVDAVHKIFEAIGASLEETFGILDVFSSTLTSQAYVENATFPFVTMANFGIHAAKVRTISKAVLIYISMFVEPDQRAEYEQYVYEHRGWVNETIEIQQTDENYYGPIIFNDRISYSIYSVYDSESDEGDIPYNTTRLLLPQWQSYPAIPKLEPAYNWDQLSSLFVPMFMKPYQERRAIVGVPYMLFNLSDPVENETHAYYVDFFKDYIPPGEGPDEPISDMIYPVIDELDKIRLVEPNQTNFTESDQPVVALIGSSVYWRDILRDILPKGSNGNVLVFNNPCSSSFTYQIDGPETIYLGRGDNHDPAYDPMKQSSSLTDLKLYAVSKSRYTGAPIDPEYCPITIDIYPSDTMESEYITRDPIIFAIVAVLIFAFTSFVFVIYDYKVERRQKVVLNSAVKSTAIVSSLYPAHIRDKLLADDEPKEKEKSGKDPNHGKDHGTITTGNTSASGNTPSGLDPMGGIGGVFGDFVGESPSSYKIKSFLDQDGNPAVCVDKAEEDKFLAVPVPIADLYENTTVMCSDISGFSTWSLNRNPEHIFILLEVLYGAFDTLAERRNILKVESIGDSYVAVIGIPDYRRNHAVVMSKFAADLLAKMTELTQRLVITLGRETTSLQLAIGVNSGPITAGVLRSTKSRFQLFGDTVMVAEQLKSTASPGCIQCSQETADLLIAAGKGSWLVKRVNLVLTRGGGVVSMYWVNPPNHSGSIAPSSLTGESEASSTQHGGTTTSGTLRSLSSTPRVRSTITTTALPPPSTITSLSSSGMSHSRRGGGEAPSQRSIRPHTSNSPTRTQSPPRLASSTTTTTTTEMYNGSVRSKSSRFTEEPMTPFDSKGKKLSIEPEVTRPSLSSSSNGESNRNAAMNPNVVNGNYSLSNGSNRELISSPPGRQPPPQHRSPPTSAMAMTNSRPQQQQQPAPQPQQQRHSGVPMDRGFVDSRMDGPPRGRQPKTLSSQRSRSISPELPLPPPPHQLPNLSNSLNGSQPKTPPRHPQRSLTSQRSRSISPELPLSPPMQQQHFSNAGPAKSYLDRPSSLPSYSDPSKSLSSVRGSSTSNYYDDHPHDVDRYNSSRYYEDNSSPYPASRTQPPQQRPSSSYYPERNSMDAINMGLGNRNTYSAPRSDVPMYQPMPSLVPPEPRPSPSPITDPNLRARIRHDINNTSYEVMASNNRTTNSPFYPVGAEEYNHHNNNHNHNAMMYPSHNYVNNVTNEDLYDYRRDGRSGDYHPYGERDNDRMSNNNYPTPYYPSYHNGGIYR